MLGSRVHVSEELASTGQIVPRQDETSIHGKGPTKPLLRSFQLTGFHLGERQCHPRQSARPMITEYSDTIPTPDSLSHWA